MSNDLLREREERAVFFDFVKCARLNVGIVENRKPPEPDIAFEIKGAGFIAMELKSLVDQTLRHKTEYQIKHHPERSAYIRHGPIRNEDGTLEGGIFEILDDTIKKTL